MSVYAGTCRLFLSILMIACVFSAGCEGIDRRHDSRVADISPPPEDYDFDAQPAVDVSALPDKVEGMMAARNKYIAALITLERDYLLVGDTVRANWARRQRELTEKVEIYPYLTSEVPEQTDPTLAVRPEQSIPEADALYEEAVKLYNTFVGIPFIGFTKLNTDEARQASDMFKRVIRDYPKSDKVDDCAFYVGEIYKEFLRNDDPDNELAIRWFKWAVALDPNTPHPARFNCAVVYDFRLHNRSKAIELYHQVLDTEEAANDSNQRFSATRIEQLANDDESHLRPREPNIATSPRPQQPRAERSTDVEPASLRAGMPSEDETPADRLDGE